MMKNKNILGVLLLVIGFSGESTSVGFVPEWLRPSICDTQVLGSDKDIMPAIMKYRGYYDTLDNFSVKLEPAGGKKLRLTISGSGNKYRRFAKLCAGLGLMALGAYSWYRVGRTRPDIAWSTLMRHGQAVFGGAMALFGGLYVVGKNSATAKLDKLKFEKFMNKPIKEHVDKNLIYGTRESRFLNNGMSVGVSY